MENELLLKQFREFCESIKTLSDSNSDSIKGLIEHFENKRTDSFIIKEKIVPEINRLISEYDGDNSWLKDELLKIEREVFFGS
ncbi:hypothetical protein M2459_001387 [Parabacteroides sp. PF5-5]|uniref:hypothetical protein n=1 Tax=unclassified Parabacteroides TaxID=2649774 RepID=UPI0024752E6C|nr:MULTISPECIES: hypothetical protein [unclassified Parabacteroides]MDH6304651.1 hypothetical protein [Parabacteroides sp. PH5-39]MDH6315735.1 hypothetical protein [Parabacteroides sp. PF5-13]MDH6319395.1 hypothetical protein [Parabacteroides sp. PH5-13]MDH6323126.1 hypothetical protein [Parabacteroides sp. PH5-8]MDH6326928.1 hypothetical protein [Parabacteroides sp. PH5-41]